MAVYARDPGEGFEGGLPGLSDAQIGTIAEDQLGNLLRVQSAGLDTFAVPLVDLGFDQYHRRVRTLRTVPTQVKGRAHLSPGGEYQITIASLPRDPRGAIILAHVPPPTFTIAPKLWAMSIEDFLKLAIVNSDGSLQFSGYLDGRFPSPANQSLRDTSQLYHQWLRKVPCWDAPVHLPVSPSPMPSVRSGVSRAAARSFGMSGVLWLASQIMEAGLETVEIAADRLRVDCVDLLLHHLKSFRLAGLAIHTSTVNRRGIVQFRIRHDTFFLDPNLWVVVLPIHPDGSRHPSSFLVPSARIPEITTPSSDRGDAGYQGSFRIDPIAPKFKDYAVPTAKIGATVLAQVFPQ